MLLIVMRMGNYLSRKEANALGREPGWDSDITRKTGNFITTEGLKVGPTFNSIYLCLPHYQMVKIWGHRCYVTWLCVPNAKHRTWPTGTQMKEALQRGRKNFRDTQISSGSQRMRQNSSGDEEHSWLHDQTEQRQPVQDPTASVVWRNNKELTENV